MVDLIRLKCLYFRSAHRGSKETDLILGPFAHAHLTTMTAAELDTFEAFLEESDSDIWDWVSGKLNPGEEYGELVNRLKQHD